MRWEALFRDLEAQAEHEVDEQVRAEAAHRTRGERASTVISARIAASRGTPVVIELLDGARVRGEVADSAGDWVLVRDGRRESLVPVRAIAAIEGLSRRSDLLSPVESSLPIASALRALSRDRARVHVRAGSAWPGVIVAVGRDHLDLATDAGALLTIPIESLREVRSA